MAEKEYIERETLKNEISSLTVSICGKQMFNDEAKASVLRVIDEQPTADVQEVRHGKWIKSKHIKFGNEFKCPFCDYSYFTDDMEYNFCPHCGAKMDKE